MLWGPNGTSRGDAFTGAVPPQAISPVNLWVCASTWGKISAYRLPPADCVTSWSRIGSAGCSRVDGMEPPHWLPSQTCLALPHPAFPLLQHGDCERGSRITSPLQDRLYSVSHEALMILIWKQAKEDATREQRNYKESPTTWQQCPWVTGCPLKGCPWGTMLSFPFSFFFIFFNLFVSMRKRRQAKRGLICESQRTSWRPAWPTWQDLVSTLSKKSIESKTLLLSV